MKTYNLNRWTTLTIKDKKFKNRVVIPPMASQTANSSGFVTEETINHYKRLTKAQAALLIVEYTYVHKTGRSEENQLGIDSDGHLEGLSKIANIIKNSGSLAGIQLNHSGGKSHRTLTGGKLMGPSAIAVPVKGHDMETQDSMNTDEIKLWVSAFTKACDRVVLAGFDLVELHSAHGYGLNQWLSPITNQRTDLYGNDLIGRKRLLLEIINAIRERHPHLLISVRLPGQDFIENGMTINESIHIAQCLENANVDLINVSSGIGGWRRSENRNGEGYLVTEASAIQKVVKIPVIGVGGIYTGEYIDHALTNAHFSLAAVGRAILQDPKQWFEQVLWKANH